VEPTVPAGVHQEDEVGTPSEALVDQLLHGHRLRVGVGETLGLGFPNAVPSADGCLVASYCCASTGD
jgi:hypothetical protein